MVMAKPARIIKDPFASPALPRSFYHPTPSRGVDANVAITGPGRDQESVISDADAHFLQAGSTLTPALANFTPLPYKGHHDLATDFNVSKRSGDHFHEIWPGSEQPSTSNIQVDISPFTSVSAEVETDKVPKQHSAEYDIGRYGARHEDGTDKTPVKTVLQKYIERFRNSEPKSRTERAKNNEANYGDFWWMHSLPASPADEHSQLKKEPPSIISPHGPSESKGQMPCESRKLTKEAVMELDKETSKLQNKADHILSKSQLSLASSGPLVSTQGLGSSTSVSELSLKTDSQAPYRPAFVNIREQSIFPGAQEAPSMANYKQRTTSQDVTSSPEDILAKWRLRRKMDEAITSSSRSSKPFSTQRVARNREMDVRLEEFRQRLLSQKMLVTQEDIQYERQKMNLLMEDETDKISNSKDKDPRTSEKSSQSHGVDPILVRLKTITSTMVQEGPTSLNPNYEMAKNTSQTMQNDDSTPMDPKSCREVTDDSIQRDSNVNNAYLDSKQDLNTPSYLHDSTWSLNKNNTAISAQDDLSYSGQDPVIDNMTSIVLCDATKKQVTLVEKRVKDGEVCVKCKSELKSLPSQEVKENTSQGDVLRGGKFVGDKDRDSTDALSSDRSHSATTDHEEMPDSVHGKQVYRQYLVAEKPNVEENLKVQDKSKHDEDESSSQGSEKSLRRRKLMKKRLKDQDMSKDKISEQTNNCHKPDKDKEDPACSENNSSSKPSQHQGASLSKITSNKKQKASKTHNIIDIQPEEVDVSARQASRISQSSSAKLKTQMSTSRPNSSQSSSQQNIQAAVIETVADHLFDGPSVISSIDSWASLFPQSPAPSRSLCDSDLATPSPQRVNASPMQSTPSHFSSLAVTETELGSSESDNEFEDDPLLSLLRQQRQDYVKKLEAIETALMKLER